MKFLVRILIFALYFSPETLYCQAFQNGDLEGVVSGGGSLPPFWLNVPYTDSNCLALNPFEDSPDLTDLNGPLPGSICGNPFSGLTFISGAMGRVSSALNFWHEGIMQSVEGFFVSESYIIKFRQAVVKNGNALDKSGSWAVYLDTILIGITLPTHSEESFCSSSLTWESRSISFIPFSSSHHIKFLPMDDDTNYLASPTDTTGALRMGIDSISLSIVTTGFEEHTLFPLEPYPNPSLGMLNIENPGRRIRRLQILSVSGAVLMRQEKVETNTVSIDLSSLAPGLYFLQSEDGDGGVRIGKFLKE